MPLQESSTGVATLPTVDPDVFYAPGSSFLTNSATECDSHTNQNFVCAYIAMEIPANQFVNGRLPVTVGSGSVSTDRSGEICPFFGFRFCYNDVDNLLWIIQ